MVQLELSLSVSAPRCVHAPVRFMHKSTFIIRKLHGLITVTQSDFLWNKSVLITKEKSRNCRQQVFNLQRCDGAVGSLNKLYIESLLQCSVHAEASAHLTYALRLRWAGFYSFYSFWSGHFSFWDLTCSLFRTEFKCIALPHVPTHQPADMKQELETWQLADGSTSGSVQFTTHSIDQHQNTTSAGFTGDQQMLCSGAGLCWFFQQGWVSKHGS